MFAYTVVVASVFLIRPVPDAPLIKPAPPDQPPPAEFQVPALVSQKSLDVNKESDTRTQRIIQRRNAALDRLKAYFDAYRQGRATFRDVTHAANDLWKADQARRLSTDEKIHQLKQHVAFAKKMDEIENARLLVSLGGMKTGHAKFHIIDTQYQLLQAQGPPFPKTPIKSPAQEPKKENAQSEPLPTAMKIFSINKKDNALLALQKHRHNMAVDTLEKTYSFFREGRFLLENVLDDQDIAFQSEFALAQSPDEQLQACQRQLKLTKSLDQRVTKMFQSDLVNKRTVHQARDAFLSAQIQLLKTQEPKKQHEKIAKLLKTRADTASEESRLSLAFYREGRVDASQVIASFQRNLSAQLSLAKTNQQKLTVLNDQLKNARTLLEMVTDRVDQKLGMPGSQEYARYWKLNLEVKREGIKKLLQ